MKAILEFNLPEEREEHELALKGGSWRNVVWELDCKLRNYLKHGHDFKKVDDGLESLRNDLHELLKDQELSLF